MYHGTHEGAFLGVAPTHRKIQFENDLCGFRIGILQKELRHILQHLMTTPYVPPEGSLWSIPVANGDGLAARDSWKRSSLQFCRMARGFRSCQNSHACDNACGNGTSRRRIGAPRRSHFAGTASV